MKKRKFKQTEIGMIPENWQVFSIESVSDIQAGTTPSTKESKNWGGDIPWITPRDLSNYKFRLISRGERCISKKGMKDSNLFLLPKGTVLLTTRAPVGYVAIAKNNITTNQGFRNLIPNNKTTSDFLYYLLKKNVEKLKANASGSTFGELSGGTLRKLKFSFPPPKEQEAIAKILSDLDEKIEVNRQMNEILEELGQTLFKRWFVDFEFPDEKGKPYKSSGGEMIESEFGEIPKEWEIKKLSEISEFKNGINYRRDENGDTEFRIVNVRNLVENNFISGNKLDLVNINRKKASPYLINPKKDILIVRSASPGEIGIIPDSGEEIIYSGFSIRCRLNEEIMFHYLYFNLLQFREGFKNYSTGTTLKNLNQQILNSKKIIVPKKVNFSEFNRLIKPLFDKVIKNIYEIRSLEQIRDSLLPKLITGKIRVGMSK